MDIQKNQWEISKSRITAKIDVGGITDADVTTDSYIKVINIAPLVPTLKPRA
jgi:hypothetical protein